MMLCHLKMSHLLAAGRSSYRLIQIFPVAHNEANGGGCGFLLAIGVVSENLFDILFATLEARVAVVLSSIFF